MDLTAVLFVALFFVLGIPWLEDYIIAKRCNRPDICFFEIM